jgi:hypothetical protein
MINGIERLPPDFRFVFLLLLGFTPLRWRLVEWGSLLKSTRIRSALRTLSSAVRASMAHFNAVLKISFFFNICTQPENFKLRRINAFITRRTKLPPSLQIIGEYDDT